VAAVAELHGAQVFAEDNRPGLRIGMSLTPAWRAEQFPGTYRGNMIQ
jgi:hypothetical protein